MMLFFTELNPTVGIDIDCIGHNGVYFITWDFSGKVWCILTKYVCMFCVHYYTHVSLYISLTYSYFIASGRIS